MKAPKQHEKIRAKNKGNDDESLDSLRDASTRSSRFALVSAVQKKKWAPFCWLNGAGTSNDTRDARDASNAIDPPARLFITNPFVGHRRYNGRRLKGRRHVKRSGALLFAASRESVSRLREGARDGREESAWRRRGARSADRERRRGGNERVNAGRDQREHFARSLIDRVARWASRGARSFFLLCFAVFVYIESEPLVSSAEHAFVAPSARNPHSLNDKKKARLKVSWTFLSSFVSFFHSFELMCRNVFKRKAILFLIQFYPLLIAVITTTNSMISFLKLPLQIFMFHSKSSRRIPSYSKRQSNVNSIDILFWWNHTRYSIRYNVQCKAVAVCFFGASCQTSITSCRGAKCAVPVITAGPDL